LSELVVRESLGERRFAATEFPIAVGGAGSAIVMAGRPPGPEAYLGLHEDQLYVQPANGAEILHNGVRVQSSTWLRSGDVVNLGAARLRIAANDDQLVVEVDDGSTGNITAPPIIPESARLQGLSDGDAERIDAIRFRASEAAKPVRRITVTPLRVVLTALAAVVVIVMWFIFTAMSVSLVTVPAKATVRVTGGLPAVRLGDRVLLQSGNYQVRAELPGYKPTQQSIKVTKLPNQAFTLTLAKLPGILRIDVPAAARVTIDGKEGGKAPGEFELEPGRHSVAIASERYQPFSADVTIEGLGKTQTFKPQLVPGWGVVTVTSDPAGAQLLVNGEPRGVTPLKAEIMAGAHPVELRLEGFKPWTTDIQVKANEPMSLGPVKLGLPDARLAVRSDPPGASVSIGGVYRSDADRSRAAAGHRQHRRADAAGLRSNHAGGEVECGRAAHAVGPAQRRVRRSRRPRAASRRTVVRRRQTQRRCESDPEARRDYARHRDQEDRLRRLQGQRHAASGRAAARRCNIAHARGGAHRGHACSHQDEVRSAAAPDAHRQVHDG
jgi:hypothetical protein